MLHDRVLVRLTPSPPEAVRLRHRHPGDGERRPSVRGGTAVSIGQYVRQVEGGDRVLFDPEDRAEVELAGVDYVLLRERDVHGVADPAVGGERTGLYL